MNIYITKLDHQLRKNISERKYTVRELEHIKEKLTKESNTRQEGFKRALLIVLGITALMLVMIYLSFGNSQIFWFTLAAVTILDLLILTLCWFACIGFLKLQFNNTVKKAYPEHTDILF